MIFYIILPFNDTHGGTSQIGTGKDIQYRSAQPAPNLAVFPFSFPHYSHFPIFITLSVTSPCVVQGAKLRPGPLKICKPASRPTGFGENFSIRPAGRLKIFHQKPCIFSPRPYLPPETSKVKPPTRHKKKSML